MAEKKKTKGMRKLRGKYYARLYYKADGKWKEKNYPLDTGFIKEAESRLIEVNQHRNLAMSGEFTPSWKSKNGIPCEKYFRLSDAKEKFLKFKRADGKRAKTLIMYETGIDRFIKAVTDKPVKDVNILDIDAFKTYYMDKLKPHTINMGLREIKAFLNWSNERGYIEVVPKIKMVHIDDAKPIYLTVDEFNEICKRVDPHFARAFWFYRETGLRLSEPFKGKIEGNFFKIEACDYKGKHDHEIFLTPEVKQILIEMQTMVEEKIKLGIAKRENAVNRYTEVFYRACRGDKQKEIEPIKHRKFHSLRHACAVRLYMRTHDIYAVMKQLGHSTVTTTEIYNKFDIKRLEQDQYDLIGNTLETVKKQPQIPYSDTDYRIPIQPNFA